MNPEARQKPLFGWPASPDAGAGRLCAIGVPSDHGNGVSRGAAQAPAAVRRAAARLVPPRHPGVDLGDQAGCAAADHDTVLAGLAAATERVIDRDLRPLVIGGDHSITYAPVSVLQRRQEMGLVWFDAHTDFSPWSEGECHSHKQVLRRIESLPGIKRLLQIGYRGLTAGDERQLGDKSEVITTAEARRLDVAALMRRMPDDVPWYISVDIDVVDPFHAPGTSAPVPDGLAPDWIRQALAAMARRRTILGADMVEVNPRLDVGDITSAVAADFLWTIADALGANSAGQ